jgi:hypothetical protein
MTETGERDGLLAAVGGRVAAAAGAGDAAGLRTPVAEADAARLLAWLPGAAGLDWDVARTAGLHHWLRAVSAGPPPPGAPPPAELLRDAGLARSLLLPLWLAHPGALPEPVEQWCAGFFPGGRAPEGEEADRVAAEVCADAGRLLAERWREHGDEPAGALALRLLRNAAGRLPAGRPSRPAILSDLAYLLLLADLRGAPEDAEIDPAHPMPHLDEALTLLREAHRALPATRPEYAATAHRLGLATRAKAVRTDDPALMRGAAGLLRMAAQAAPDGDPGLPFLLGALSDTLWAALGRSWAEPGGAPVPGVVPDELAEAVDVLRWAVRLLPDDAPALPHLLGVLAERLTLRSVLGGGPADGEHLLAVAERLLRVVPDDRPHPLLDRYAEVALRRLGGPLPARGAGAGPADRDALAGLLPPEAAGAAREFQRLSGLLTGQGAAGIGGPAASLLGVVADIVGLGGDGGDSRSARDLGFAGLLLGDASPAELAGAALRSVQERYAHLPPRERGRALLRWMLKARQEPARPADVPLPEEVLAEPAEVLAVAEEMLAALPPDDPDRPLLRTVRAQLRLVRGMHDADAAPAGGRLAAFGALLPVLTDLLNDDLPGLMARAGITEDLFRPMAALSTAMTSPFENIARAEEMLRELRAGLAALPPGTAGDGPRRVELRRGLAFWLFQYHTVTDEDGAYREALAIVRDLAARRLLAPVDVLFWGNAVAGRAGRARIEPPADEAELPSSGITRRATRAAAEALADDDPRGALETVEEGRAFLLSQALVTRQELDGLRRADPALAGRFEELRGRLAAIRPTWPPDPERMAAFRALAGEWAALSEEVAALPGTERFLLPLPLGTGDLLPAAAEGPVVTVNLDPRRCDALLLRSDGVRAVPLPDLRAGDALAQAAAFHDAIGVLTAPGGAVLAAEAGRVVTDTLGWLWDVVAEPVLDALGFGGPPAAGPPPRVWWSPGGVLNGLPLHAAGRPGRPGASVPERVVSSYTPTLRALMLGRVHAPVPGRPRTALSVAMPDTPGHSPLPRTADEAAGLLARLPGARSLTGPAATRRAVLAALPGASVAHFACHASGDPARPADSHLLLHDGPLRLDAIGRLRLEGAELAYLSACGTARGGARLADEAIHAAAAFQLAGYGQVVATLWEVGDDFAASAAAAFHRELGAALTAADRLPGARALHAVTRELRAAWPQAPWAWSALVHAGA